MSYTELKKKVDDYFKNTSPEQIWKDLNMIRKGLDPDIGSNIGAAIMEKCCMTCNYGESSIHSPPCCHCTSNDVISYSEWVAIPITLDKILGLE